MTVTVKYIDASGQSSWNRYVARHPERSFYHAYEWRGFFADFFSKDTYYLVAERDGKIIGLVPLVRQRSAIFGNYIVSLPFVNYGGILADSAEVAAALVAEIQCLAGRERVEHVELRGLSAVEGLPVKTNKVAMHLSLPGTSEELSAGLGSKLRSQIRRPQREGPETAVGGVELVDDFYAVFSRNMRDLGTPVYPKSMFVDILQRFPGRASIVVIRLEGAAIAAGFLLHNEGTTEVPWASSDRRYNRISINMLLYWEMLSAAIAQGSSVFDFGRSSEDSGTFRFKKQWGAKPVQLHWSYWLPGGGPLPELNPENSRYQLAIRTWQKLPVWATRLIGPLLARNLP